MSKKQPPQYLKVSERDGQVSATGGQLSNFFVRNVPMWNTPVWQNAEFWRKFVVKQPIAVICRERIASYLNSLDWQITPVDPEQRDELRLKIRYYTKLLEKGSTYYTDLDFSSHVEWLVKDLHDLPFGTASEIGRVDDKPNGKVVWIRPLDGGTLAPTLNFEYPVVQQSVGTGLNPIYIPRNFVSRVYLSPLTELSKEGWGYAPPERIYLAIEMLSRGDNYYAQLLLNTPEAGIIDLGDMEKTSALEWVQSLRDLLYGISPLKIPVLYEHTSEAKFIPFGKPPSEIMYNDITLKYAAILCAGYGLTLADIGLGGSGGAGAGGDTLAGTIRSERVTKSSGFATAKKKIAAYFNKILPDSIQFGWIDYDDEKNVAKGRARLATAQATDILVRNKAFKPSEMRQQMLADGLISITVPETIDPNDPEFAGSQPQLTKPNFGGSRRQQLGDPVAPSSGGQGEIIPQQVIQRNTNNAEVNLTQATVSVNEVLSVLCDNVTNNLSKEELEIWNEYVDGYLVGLSEIEEEKLATLLGEICKRSEGMVKDKAWTHELSNAIAEKILSDALNEAISKSVLSVEDATTEQEDRIKEEQSTLIEQHRSEVENFTRSKFVENVSKFVVLVSKSMILDGKLDVDSTELVSENIKVSREVAKEVLQNLSLITKSVYDTGKLYLESMIGEQDAGN